MSSSFLDKDNVKSQLSDPDFISKNAFEIMRSLCSLSGDESKASELQDLILRLLEHRACLNGCEEILDSLIREVGLFPFLEPDRLSFSDRLAYEFHKPISMKDDIVFHRPQAHVYRELMSGNNVVLSAPTSFGKSLIIDAVISSRKFTNILVIVPTIALIDETRRRISLVDDYYKIITHPFQQPAERNVFVLTQERVLELSDISIIDFFVLDEFYKLSDGEERSALLNQALYKLVKQGKQFYMLGPSVTGILDEVETRLKFTFLCEPYHTVVSELHRVKRTGDDLETLAQLCKTLKGPTIIFCQSPPRAAEVAKYLIERGVGQTHSELDEAVKWISEEYHSEWHFVRALSQGIGVHHGRIPRALAQFIVRAFDAGSLSILICTSTLIEGVNTKAENIIIFDNKINKQKYDYFTFNNIRGRSGRMLKHFIGHVYVFHDPPQENLPFVDIPAFSQSDHATDSLLIQMDEDDLTASSKERIKEYKDRVDLSYSTIRANNGIEPDTQIGTAQTILSSIDAYHRLLNWNSFPSWVQLLTVCSLIWDNFNGMSLGAGSVKNARQLATLINKLKTAPSISSLIDAQLTYDPDPDKAVPAVLDFLRLWATFNFPRLLRALDLIQRDVFVRNGLKAGDYGFYASKVESLFLDPTVLALEEYGIPIQLSIKLESYLQPDGDLDAVLRRLKALDVEKLEMSSFEADLLKDAQIHIGILPINHLS